MEQVKVIAFLLYKDGKILVERRKQTENTDAGKVVIPGGHVRKRESLKQACKRELKEELGLDGNKFNFITKLIHHTEIEDQLTYYFSCEKWRGSPRCLEAEKIFWIGLDQLYALDFEIDRKAVKEFFKKRGA